MIDRLHKQHKLKNWKIINKSISKDQSESRANRSCFEQQPKKYCPRKDSSKQKIFAKSKERFNSFTAENVSEVSNDLKKNLENKTEHAMIPLPKKTLVDIGVQTSKYLFEGQLEFENSFKSDQQLINVHQKQPTNNKYHPKSFYELKNNRSGQQLGGNGNITLNDMLQCDMVGIKQIKQEFQLFKVKIVEELKKQRQFMEGVVEKLLGECNKFNLKNYEQPLKLNHNLDSNDQLQVNTSQQVKQSSKPLKVIKLPFQESYHVQFQPNTQVKPQQPYYSQIQESKSLKSASHLNILHLLSSKIRPSQFPQRKLSNQVVDMQGFNKAIKKLKTDLIEIKSKQI